jgi:hypothetical protein
MPEFNHHQWKMIFTAVRKYQKEHPRIVPCYTEMYDELSQILDALYPYAYSETYIENEQQTINT